MHAMTLAAVAPLVPSLLLCVGAIIVGTLGVPRRSDSRLRWIGLLAAAFALGATVRLWAASRVESLVVSPIAVPSLAPSAPATQQDLLSASCAVGIAVVGLAFVQASAFRGRPRALAASLLATSLALAVVGVGDARVTATLWTALVCVGAAELIGARQVDDASSVLSLALVGAPLLTFAAAVIAPAVDGPPSSVASAAATSTLAGVLVVLAGGASAGLGPFARWRRASPRSALASQVVDDLLPLVGFYLAAHATLPFGGNRPIVVDALLIILGISGAIEAMRSSLAASDAREFGSAAGAGDVGLAFIALAVGTNPALAAGLFLVVASVVARASSGVVEAEPLARLGWASIAGLPPLPGYVGRLLVALAVLESGRWPLVLTVVGVVLVLGIGTFGSRSFRPSGESVAFDPRAWTSLLIGLGGIVPVQVLLPALLPRGWFPDFEPRSVLLANLVVLGPLLFAVIFVRRRALRRFATADALVTSGIAYLLDGVVARVADAEAVVESRYNLAFGFLIGVVAVLTLVR